MEIDSFAMRSGGSREDRTARRPDASLAYYIGQFPDNYIFCFSNEYSPDGPTELVKCKALSKHLADAPLPQTAPKAYCVRRSAILQDFCPGFESRLLLASTVGPYEEHADAAKLASELLKPTIGLENRSESLLEALANVKEF